MSAIATVGAGIFGTRIAVELARAGHTVDLFEKNDDILCGATFANQGRLHYGYHYPRSPMSGLREHAQAFAREYPRVVTRDSQHYYCIAGSDSTVSGAEYLDFCRSQNLPFEVSAPSAVRRDAVDVCVRVPEALIDVRLLRAELRSELDRFGVRVLGGRAVDSRELTGYEWVINATYGLGWSRPLRYELCETVAVQLDPRLHGVSVVVMDGPFVSLDPVPRQHCHLLYDVVHSVHTHTVGPGPDIPAHLRPLVDQGLVKTPHSHVAQMLGTARAFLRHLDDVTYLGSRFAVRAVLPDVDSTDERPTLFDRDGNHISVLSGKLNMAVWAAQQVLQVTRQEQSVI